MSTVEQSGGVKYLAGSEKCRGGRGKSVCPSTPLGPVAEHLLKQELVLLEEKGLLCQLLL